MAEQIEKVIARGWKRLRLIVSTGQRSEAEAIAKYPVQSDDAKESNR